MNTIKNCLLNPETLPVNQRFSLGMSRNPLCNFVPYQCLFTV